MKIWKYENYEEYVEAQTRANIRKINLKWVEKPTIAKIYSKIPFASNILCHGTRNAAEQKFFKEFYPSANIIGTEISHTAENFPMTIQHDFHEEKSEWLNKFDIIYSNSFDHSYDPIKCLTAWKNQLNDSGSIFIEHGFDEMGNRSRPSDPLELSEDELLDLFKQVKLKFINKENVSKEAILHELKK